MLKLKRLHLRNIGRFVEPQIINFDALGNFVQVDGDNKNTGGSSGSAKTTIFNAHDYLLGVSDVPATILQSRITKEPMFVQGDYDWDGKELSIARGKKDGLVITVDGVVKSGSVKLLEEELDKILAVPRELFRQMFHKRQFARGFFLSMTPKETYEFLTSCLNLEKEKAKVDALDKKIKELTEKKESVNNTLEVQKQGKRAIEDALLTLGLGPVKDMHEEVIASLLEKVNTSKRNYVLLEEQHRLQLAELLKTKPAYSSTPFISESFTPVPFDTAKLNQYEEAEKIISSKISAEIQKENARQAEVNRQISHIRLLISDHTRKIEDGERAKNDAGCMAAQIKTIRDSLCPTCEQTWANQKAKDQEQRLMEGILSLKKLVVSGEESKKIVEDSNKRFNELVLEASLKKSDEHIKLESDQKRLDYMILDEKTKKGINEAENNQKRLQHDQKESERSRTHNSAETAKNHAIMAGYTAKEDELRAKQRAELQQASGQLDIDARTHMAAEEKLRAYQTSKSAYDASVAKMKAQHDEYAQVVNKLTNELDNAIKEFALAEEAKRAIKSYISRSFDEALETISDMTTRIIRHIPNMANATVQLEGLRETKEGKVKEEVNAVVNMDGDEGIPLKSLSGGEGSALHLAVDLSVIDLIEQKTAKGINIFILDEPFTGMDTVCIEMALEVLKNSNTNKKLIIVDHNPEVKQMVQSRLVVVREGTTSNVVQA